MRPDPEAGAGLRQSLPKTGLATSWIERMSGRIKQAEEDEAKLVVLKAEPRVREEIYADWMAGQSCLKLFGGASEHSDLVVAIHLAMENLTTIALVPDFPHDRAGDELSAHTDVVAVRKRALRQSLEYWMQEQRTDVPRLGHRVLTTANQRYMHYVRDPITMDALTKVETTPLPDEGQLAEFRPQLVASVPQAADPQFIVRKRPFARPQR